MQSVLAVPIVSAQSVLVEFHVPGRLVSAVQLSRWPVGDGVVLQRADFNSGVPLEADSSVGDALTSADASDGVVLQPTTSTNVADASVGKNDGVSASAGGTSVYVIAGAGVVSAGRDHGPSGESSELSVLTNSSRRLHAIEKGAPKLATSTPPLVDDMFLSKREPEYKW